MYLVIEGQDATGKSTQVEMLAQLLRDHGQTVVTLHEPDGDLAQTHALRELVKNRTYELEPLTHVLLFAAARLELWRKLAEPTLKAGGIVISSRNWWSSLAYQGYGQGVSLDRITKINHQTLPKPYLQPTRAVILTLADATRLQRQSYRDNNSAKDTFESRAEDFQQRVNQAYLKIARQFQIPLLDAAASPHQLHCQLLKLFQLDYPPLPETNCSATPKPTSASNPKPTQTPA